MWAEQKDQHVNIGNAHNWVDMFLFNFVQCFLLGLQVVGCMEISSRHAFAQLCVVLATWPTGSRMHEDI